MAEIIRLKVQNSDNGRNVCAWTADGGVEIFPCTPKVDELIDQLMSAQLTPNEFYDKCMELNDFETGVQEAAKAINVKLERVSDRLTTDGMHIYIDGATFESVRLDPALEKHLLRLMKERGTDASAMKDWKCYAAFAENLYTNVTPYIREQLVSWMEAQDWMIFTEDGCFIGYKGCQKNADTGVAESISCGPAIVDGLSVNGHVPNPDGAIVEIARNLVVDNPAQGCASGLHVGTYDYAHGFGHGLLLRVKVNPRDVISVPTDCSAQKIRCCRYEVLDHEEYEYSEPVAYDRTQLGWWDDDEFDEEREAELFEESWEPECDCVNFGGYHCDYTYYDNPEACLDCDYFADALEQHMNEAEEEWKEAHGDDCDCECGCCDECDAYGWACDGLGDDDVETDEEVTSAETACDFFSVVPPTIDEIAGCGCGCSDEKDEPEPEKVPEGATAAAARFASGNNSALADFAKQMGVTVTIITPSDDE